MILKSKQLIGLLVVTKSGKELGHLDDFEVESDDGKIIKYIIVPSKIMSKILKNELIIDWSQIIEITDQKIIVDDGSVSNTKLVEDFI